MHRLLAPTPENRYNDAVQLFHTPLGICTAWRYSHQIFITAAHCVSMPGAMDVGGSKAVVVTADEDADLAAVFVVSQDGPGLPVSQVPIAVEDPILMVGFGYGDPALTVLPGVNSHLPVHWQMGVATHLVFNAVPVGGMSGGPIFNRQQEVVSVVQADGLPAIIGFGAGQKELHKFLGSF